MTHRNIFKKFIHWWTKKEIKPDELVPQNRAHCGFDLVAAMREPDVVENTLLKILDLYREGKIRPKIDSIWSFDAVST